MQSYNDVINEVKNFDGCKVLGYIENEEKFPFFVINRGNSRKGKVLVSAGVHGDEPAGVFAIIEFLKKEIKYYENDFEFIIFVCVNPTGFQKDSRDNFQGLNLNREFKLDSTSNEIQLILSYIKNEKFLFTMDFHETWANSSRVTTSLEPDGEDPIEFYFWEICTDKSKRIGKRIIENIKKENIEVCNWEKIYGDINSNGVIWYPEGNGTPAYALDNVFDSHMAKYYTSQAFTIETARQWEMSKRVKAHLVSVKTVLDYYASLK